MRWREGERGRWQKLWCERGVLDWGVRVRVRWEKRSMWRDVAVVEMWIVSNVSGGVFGADSVDLWEGGSEDSEEV